MTLADTNKFDVTIQLVVTFGAIVIAAIPLLISQRRVRQKQEDISQKQDELYEHINNLEDDEEVPVDETAEPPVPRRRTLGSTVRDLERKLEEGFAGETETHEAIKASIAELRELVGIPKNGR